MCGIRDLFVRPPIPVDLRGLLDQDVDELSQEPQENRPTFWSRWRGRIVSFAGLGVSLAVRAFNWNRVTNILSSFTAGGSMQSVISTSFKGESSSRTREVCLTIFGQLVLFFVSQGYDNTSRIVLKVLCDDVIFSQAGANLEIIIRWFREHGLVENESNFPGDARTESPSLISTILHMPQPVKHLIKSSCTGASVATFVLFRDNPVVAPVAFFVFLFFPSQMLGEKGADLLDRQITRHDVSSSSLTEGGTNYRRVKRRVIFIAKGAFVVSFMPWQLEPNDTLKLVRLGAVAVGTGLSSGFTEQTAKRRAARADSLGDLEEFQKLDPPRQFACLYKGIWNYAIPSLLTLGVSAFAIDQVIVLSDKDAKISIAFASAGILIAYWSGKYVEWRWSTNTPGYEKWMSNLWIAPRILGFPPLILYLAGTNILLMDSRAIEEGRGAIHTVIEAGAWTCYGLETGRITYVHSSDIIGNPLLKFPDMLFANVAMMLRLALDPSGKLEV